MTTARVANITKTLVDSLAQGEVVRDAQVKGFGVRRQQGRPVFFVQKRADGRMRWITIGTYGSPWTVHQARNEALRLLGEIATGTDPQAERQESKQKELGRISIAAAAPTFMAEHGPKLKPRTREEYERLLKLHIVPMLGAYKLDELSRATITRFHSGMAATPAAANFALAVISKMMTWAEHTGRRPENANPCRSIQKFRTRKLERYLTSAELIRLGEALAEAEEAGTESEAAIAAIRLLLLTGARRNEILSLQWSEVDFERQALRLRESKTGEKVIKLGAPALQVLASLSRLESNPFVIVGDRHGRHLVNIQSSWERIRAATGIPDVRLHDLRHSFASFAVASGASLPMIGKLLGHTQPQTTARYAHLADDPLTQLNDAISGAIGAAIMPRKRKAEDDAA